MPLGNGQVFAGYTIVRQLGSGGMGEVYLAEHPRLPRRDALKLLPEAFTADAGYRARFHREADLASTLWHPHIVGVHDRGETDGQLWIAMDFVDGVDGAHLLAERYPNGMPVDLVVRVVMAVASALDHAHKKGLLHRDVKPANIMLTHLDDEDGEQRILLADFGIARDIGEVSGITTTNMTVGTVAYAAPEQLMGEDLDGRSDQYALTATAYHLLTGATLFPHSLPAVVISRHLNTAPPKLSEIRPELADLDPVLGAALSKHPADRYARCQDFARALAEPVGASIPAAIAPTKPAVPVAPKSELTKPAPVKREPSAAAAAPSAPPPPGRRWIAPVAIAGSIVLTAAIGLAIWQPWKQDDSSNPAATSTQASASPISSPTPPAVPPPRPTFAAASIDSVLLSSQEVNDELGTYTTSATQQTPMMKLEDSSYGMSDNSALVTPQACVGLIFGAEHRVYAGTGFEEMRDQTFRPETYVVDRTISPPYVVQQTVAVYPTAQRAQQVLTSSQKQWESCAKSIVTEDVPPENSRAFELGTVQRNGDLLAVKMAANSYVGASACQHVLGVRDNVVIGTRSCNFQEESAATAFTGDDWPTDPDWADDDAQRLAQSMLDKVTT